MNRRMATAIVAILVWTGCSNSPSDPDHSLGGASLDNDPVVEELGERPGELHNAVIEAYLRRRSADGEWRDWDRFVANFRDAVNEVLEEHGAASRVRSDDVWAILEHHRRLAVQGIVDVTRPTFESLHRYVDYASDRGVLSAQAAAAEHQVIEWVRLDGVREALDRAHRQRAVGELPRMDPDFRRFLDVLDASNRLWSRYELSGPDAAGIGSAVKRIGSKIVDSTVGLMTRSKFKRTLGNAVSSILFEEAWDWADDHVDWGAWIHWPPPPCPTCFPCQPVPCGP